MKRTPVVLSISQALATACFAVLAFTLLNGYTLNLVGGYRANPWLVLAGVVVEFAVMFLFARRWVRLTFDPFEFAGWLLVVGGVWLYFISAAWPTLLPPTLSVDAVRHYTQALFSYPNGTLVSWYPAGGAFVVAMFSRWLGVQPLYMLHPVASLFIALTAGAVFGITGALLPRGRYTHAAALVAPALLFVPWSYFAGIIDWEQYFFAQAFAQYFVVMALWYLMSYVDGGSVLFLVLFGVAILGIVATYPYLVLLPIALFVVIALARLARGRPLSVQNRAVLISLGAFIALLVLAALALERGGILQLATIRPTSTSDVGEGGVTHPSVQALGGPVFLLLAAAGLVPAWRVGARGRTVVGLLLAWVLQLGALAVVQPALEISGYRIDKTFYILIFPLAILGALGLTWLIRLTTERAVQGSRPTNGLAAWAFVPVAVILAAAVLVFRPPKVFSPFTPAELDVAFWARENVDTYQVHSLDSETLRAYWLAFGLWRETLPNEWFQWMPAGAKLGPATYDEWLHDPAWGDYLMVSDSTRLESPGTTVVYKSGSTALLRKQEPAGPAAVPSHAASWYYEATARLLGYDLPRRTFAAGDVITLTTYTTPLYPPAASVEWRLELVDRNGAVATKTGMKPFGDKYPVQRWHPGPVKADQWSVPLPADLPPGIYEVNLGLYRTSDGEFTDVHPLPSPTAPQTHLTAAPLDSVKIALAAPPPAELNAATRLDTHIGDDFALAAYAFKPDRASRTVRLTLYWQSVLKTDTDYTVFVHLLDPAGKILAQRDAAPRDGTYPTSAWDPSEIVTEEYNLTIPSDSALASSIEIGMYLPANGQRLRVGADDKITLAIREW